MGHVFATPEQFGAKDDKTTALLGPLEPDVISSGWLIIRSRPLDHCDLFSFIT